MILIIYFIKNLLGIGKSRRNKLVEVACIDFHDGSVRQQWMNEKDAEILKYSDQMIVCQPRSYKL